MPAHFRAAIEQVLPFAHALEDLLTQMQGADWQAVADVFAAKLPEVDAVYGMPGAEAIAARVAQARGVPDLTKQDLSGQVLSGQDLGTQRPGELMLLSAHLQQGHAEREVVAQARAAGWVVTVLGVAVERTSQGARKALAQEGLTVRALIQLADTPKGLVFERRAPDRWTTEQEAEG